MARTRAKAKKTTMEETVGITEKQLRQLVDALGEVNDQLKELQKRKDDLRKAFLDLDLPEGTYEGYVYRLQYSTRQDAILSPEKTYRIVGSIRNLLPLVSVSVTKARKELSATDFERCVESYKETKTITTKKK
ncbi:MAG TPA: hypothetical protein ENF20_01840 [Candidatus Marinimicrobia bacterium]|nr:hypothetical protein [Candidatus Neomarinimicrobiota bacterium]